MMKITRRQFVQTSAAMVSCAGALPRFAVADESFLNCSPSRQTLSVDLADILTRVTGFDFGPRVVNEAEGHRFAHVLRREFGRIQDEAMSKVVTIRSDQLGWLGAFVRSGPFRIQRTAQFVSLSVEV